MAEDTDLFAELSADQGPNASACNVGALLASMDSEERAQWEVAFANPSFTAASIHRALERRGHNIGGQPVQRHARRIRHGQGCLCPR